MSFFGNLFNFGKSAAAAKKEDLKSNESTIQALHNQIDLLEKRNAFIQTKQQKLLVDAKTKLNAGDKKGALLILNQKKKIEEEIEKNHGSQLMLENQLSALESATMNKQVIESLMRGNNSIKKINKDMPINKIEDLMEDIQEEHDNYRQIQEAMSNPLHQIYDDEALLSELEEIETAQDLLAVDDDSVTVTTKFPSVPTMPLPSSKTAAAAADEDEELRQLELSMM